MLGGGRRPPQYCTLCRIVTLDLGLAYGLAIILSGRAGAPSPSTGAYRPTPVSSRATLNSAETPKDTVVPIATPPAFWPGSHAIRAKLPA